MFKKKFPSLSSLGGSDGSTSFLRAARGGHLDKVLEHLRSNIDINTSNANGLNALHLASKDGHVEVVSELLKRGAVVDSATKKGNTALHIASLAGQEEVVKLLIQHGASVNVQSQNGFTPLYMAAQENHDNVVKYLLSNGANQSLATEDGFTPLAVAMQQGHDKVVAVLLESDTRGKVRLPALHIAAKKDDVKAAKLLLENEHNPDVTSKSGFTPLHIASHYGNEAVANLLVSKGADVNFAAKHHITPLHVAAKWGKANMVSLLIQRGAQIDAKTRDGLTPLHCAARSGHENVVDSLLERGAPISSKTKNGLAPLHMAAQGEHVDAARVLLFHRAPVDEVTVDYLTALHVAAHCGHVRVAKLLLDRQADANARALNGFTPLHIACKKNRIKVVELLLKHGASISATTESGLTPLHVASFMGCMNIVIYLLQHDANPDVPTVRGETPLHLAARANQTDIIRILLRNGAQVDARAREQQTPLHIAARLGNVDIVMLLLQHGAKADAATKDMYTALHIAAKEGQDEVASALLDNGASLNATTKKGFTPLHLAAKYGHIKVAKLLLQREAPVDAQGKNGVTPLHVASHYDHQDVALLLLDRGASPHAAAKNGHTPLHIAARKNQMDIAGTLLEFGAKADVESRAGFTPLHLASQEGHADMAALLIEHQADTNHQSKNGLTPLHLCAQEERVDVAELLVKQGAHVTAETESGYTPLHVASHCGQAGMVRFLLKNGANVAATTEVGYTPLHHAAQQGHSHIVAILLEHGADPNALTNNGQTAHSIAQRLGYITVTETLKPVTSHVSSPGATDEKYRVVAPEAMHETFMSDSEEEGGEDTMLGDQPYRYLTVDEMKSLGDDSLPIDVTRDERAASAAPDSNRSAVPDNGPPRHMDDTISPQHIYASEYAAPRYVPDNIDIKHQLNIGFLVSFLVDARGGAMRGCRHSGVRVVVPPRSAAQPTRVTCRYVKPQRAPHPPPLMEGEALASRVLELGPVGAKFLGPVILEVPHFAALRGKEREIVILRSDNGETWREHTVESAEDIVQDVLTDSFEAEDLSQLEDIASGRITRIVTHDFPQYFAVVSRVRQEVHAIGPEGGMVSSSVVPQVQAVFPQGALTKKIKVGLQAQPIDPELTAKLLGHGVAVSPVVTVEPRRRKFHKAITLSMPAPQAHSQGMINQYSGNAPTLRLLCSITGGTTRAQWEDVTGSTPLTFVNDCVSFTTTVSARFWLMDCRNIGDATKMATELYREAIHVPFMAKFVVFAKRVDPLEARLRVFCMTDDREDKTLEQQEHFTEVAKSRDVEVLEGKPQYVEFAGNLVPVTKSGEQLQFSFKAFRENRLPFTVRVKDQHADIVGRCLFMREPKVPKGEPPQHPICVLNIVLPENIVAESYSVTEPETLRRFGFIKDDDISYTRGAVVEPRFSDMANLLGSDWVPLAEELGLNASEINTIKSESPDSDAKQAQTMLRLWRTNCGNKTQGNTLELALRKIGREDIIPQVMNIDTLEQHLVKTRHDQSSLENIKDLVGSKDSSLRRNISLDNAYDEQDMMKDSESIESLVTERKDSYGVDPRLKNISERDETKYIAEEKAVSNEEESGVITDEIKKSVAERRQEIEKRLSSDREIPPSIQKTEIVQEITSIKRQSLVDDRLKKPSTDTEPVKDVTTTITTTEVITTEITDVAKPEMTKTKTEKVEIVKIVPKPLDGGFELEHKLAVQKEKIEKMSERTSEDESTNEPQRTDVVVAAPVTHFEDVVQKESTLIDEVIVKLDKPVAPRVETLIHDDVKSPKQSKTPPPSPAEFLMRERAAAAQEWSPSGEVITEKPQEDEKSILKDAIEIPDETTEETTGEPLTTIATTTTQNITELTPKPKPRITKQLDSQIELTSPIESFELTDDIPLSPVQNESTNIEKVQVGISPSENINENYSYRKKFWEGMSSSNQTGKKRMSLATETVTTHDSSQFKKRTSVHEVEVVLPIPKPRSTVQQQIVNDEEVLDNEDKKPLLSEYMASFQCPLQDEKEPKKRYVESPQTEIDVPETLDSNEQYDIHGGYDNDGFRSDSVESEEFDDRLSHLIGDTDQPPIAAVRTILLERSASLPTSDLSTTRILLEKKQSRIKSDLLESSDLIDDFYLHKRSDIDPDLKLNYKKGLIDEPPTDVQPLHVSAATETYITSKVEENVENIALDNSQTIRLSLEMHVDKSELEDSEKFVEIEQSSSYTEKRFERELDSISKVGQILDLEKEQKDFIHELRALSPINMPEEHVPDTVWEVPIQSQPITVEEAVTYIPTTQVVSTDTKFKTDKKQDLIPLNLQSNIAEEEAKIKAKELISNIEDELQKRYDCFATEIEETSESTPDPELAQNQVSEYLHQLASAKGLDESEVELVKSILARKQLSSIERTDTQTSSTEITDEDLKCTDLEINNLLSEIKKPETKSAKPDLLAIEKTLAEVQESLHAAQEELLETGLHKKPSPSEFQFKSLAHEKKKIDKIEETQYEDISKDYTTMHGSTKTQTHSYIEEEFKNKHHERIKKSTKETSDLKSEAEERVRSIDQESIEILSSHKIEALETIVIEEKTNEIELATSTKQISISNISNETNLELTEKITTEKLTLDKDSTSESKSREEQTSSTSSCRKTDTDSLRTSDASDVLLRKSGATKDTDTSSSSGAGVLRATDRRSTVDNEAWSSSGESYYQSFEQDSLRSRPCSSDVEGLVAAGGSSEYESALTTQDKSYLNTTSAEYHTAVSSISSRESMKSLDSESSGNLASVEVSEASETLVPSAFELDGDFPDETQNDEIQDEIADFDIEIKDPIITHITDITSVDILGHTHSSNQVNRTQPDESIDISEEDSSAHEIKTFNVNEDEIAPKMKRSYEMTFQPEPRIIIADSPQSETGTEIDEKFVTSVADGSISYSSTSETSMQKTVVDITQTPGMNMLDSLEQLSMEDSLSDIKDNVTHDASTKCVSDVASSKTYENDYQNIQTKILSCTELQEKTITEQNGPTQVDYIPEYDNTVEQKKKGHRRQESSTSFTPTIISQIVPIAHSVIMESPQKDYVDSKNIEFDKVEQIIKRTDSDGEPEVDTSETKPDSEYSRPQSQVSKSDSESHKAISIGLSDDRPDSELSELLKQCSSEAPDDPIERPPSPEPTDVFEKSESSGTQAGSGRESELEFSSPYPRSPDYQTAHTSIDYNKTESVTIESKIKSMKSEIITKVSDISDLTIKSLEKSSTEESEAEAAFQMVPHTSPVHQAKFISTILEDVDAEKHEIEKKYVKESNIDSNLQDQSPYIPDITVTQHMAPLVDRGFHYPDLELEQKEDEVVKSTPQTPASISSKSSEDTDQGREYILNECDDSIPEEIESCLDEKMMTESRSEISTTTEEKTTIYETETKEPSSPTESPTSDSFEMLEKPDITDEFVVIEEVGREAAETDTEGKSVAIRKAPKYIRKHDGEVEEYLIKSAPAKLTDIKYYPEGGSSSDELGPFEFEDSPPTMDKKSSDKKTGKNNLKEYERDVEASKKWMEMQFQDQSTAAAMAAAAAAGYGYEMEFERLPLEDIKEEEMTDFDPSSRMGSLGSQKNSGGSYSSVKDSFSSTPDYDVLAGRKFFTRSSDHDDISMSSLQEFENLEQAISLENRKYQHGSQDSLSNGSFPKRYYASKSGQGDDVSCSSLKEFEGLETACIQAHKIEIKAKEEEALLAQIDEGHESTFSESESCETVSITSKKYVAESEEDDYEKRMFEIDEIIRQAQSNVEKFIDQKDLDRTQSLGRGDSLEEVAKVPDLELDAPVDKNVSSQDNIMIMSTDSLDIKKSELNDNSDSLKNVIDLMNTSTDSIEFQNRTRETTKDIMTDSIEMHEPLQDRSIVASDSLELTASMDANLIVTSDSIDEDGSRIGEVIFHDKSSSSGKEGDPSSSSKDVNVKYADLMLGSTDSLEPSSSTATHATYQYETDSVFSGSFTSGGSNTMVSSTDTIDPNAVASGFQGTDLSAALCQVWSDDNSSSGEGNHRFDTRYYTDDLSKPYVTEVIEPCESGSEFSHTIHRTVELPAEIQKVTFCGPDVEGQIEKYMEEFNEGEMVHETEEVDADGNVHVKRVIQKRIIIKPENKNMSESEMKSYVHHYMNERKEMENVPMSDYDHLMTSIARDETPASSDSDVVTHRTYVTRHITTQGDRWEQSTDSPIEGSSTTKVQPETEEASTTVEGIEQREVPANLHGLSDEMKELLAEMEKQARK